MIPDKSLRLQTRPSMTLPANMQLSFDAEPAAAQLLTLPDAELLYIPHAFAGVQAQRFLEHFLHEVPWRQDHIHIAGKKIAVPRLQNWFGDSEAHYSYSGIALSPLSWTQPLLEIKDRVQRLSQCQFNSVLANQYRDGHDSVSWHSDDEPELGAQPVIASVSFGASRCFELRHRERRTQPSLRLVLDHGSVLVMRGTTQECWMHQVPKEKGVLAPRINLTFRRILSSGERA
jgi:alkylated DNA repair dioxygenase AlkB